MMIKSKEALDFFLKNGILATLRTYPYERKLGKKIRIRLAPFRNLCATVIKVIIHPDRDDLKQYVSISGFQTIEEWWNKAIQLHRRKPTRLVVIKFCDRKPIPTPPGLKLIKVKS